MNLFSVVLCSFAFACGPTPPARPVEVSSDVLVVWNANAPESKQIVDKYIKARSIPDSNVLSVKTVAENNIPLADYREKILKPVIARVSAQKLKINYILLIRGMPIRLDSDEGYSLDAFLMVDAHKSKQEKPLEAFPFPKPSGGKWEINGDALQKVLNPYFMKDEHFDSDKFGFYLCTRLDGYTVADALKLIDNSVNAKAEKGTFLFDASPGRSAADMGMTQAAMPLARKLLEERGYTVALDQTNEFIGNMSSLMGYASWGSNDGSFDQGKYNSLSFKPGALAETYVSTSGRSFRPTSGGQSLIADLIRQGVTGVKGYVSEPFTFALARVDILFDRYTRGYNLAESFFMASPVLKWKDIVIGDPLCSPYAVKN